MILLKLRYERILHSTNFCIRHIAYYYFCLFPSVLKKLLFEQLEYVWKVYINSNVCKQIEMRGGKVDTICGSYEICG